ncbi:hypothetical protein SMD22_00305 (plasmid) [Brevibacillus halotolerans]|nr:hypothetical protein SMD22_00305 [Brevibacillus halotolerans]
MSREIDAKVAELLGLNPFWEELRKDWCYYSDLTSVPLRIPHYSSTGDGMLLLLEKIKSKLSWNVILVSHLRAFNFDEGFTVNVFDCYRVLLTSHEEKESAPRAVSLAVLKAKGVDITPYI